MSAAPGKHRLPIADQRSLPLIGRLWRAFVRPYSAWLLGAAIAAAMVAAATAASAWLMDPVVNKVFVERDRDMLWLIGGGVLGIFVVKSLAAYLQESVLSYVGQRIVADVQKRLLHHLLDQDVALFQSRQTGTLISHFTFDVQALRQAVSTALVGLGRDGLSIVFLAAVMVYQDWLLSPIALVVAPISVVPIQRLGKRMRRMS